MVRMIFKGAVVVVLTLISLIVTAYSQPVSTLVQGKLLNSSDGKPIGAKITFISKSGKKINCKSNSSDGSFQQSVDAGEEYSVAVTGYLLTDNEIIFSTPKNSYTEINKDIRVKKIEQGMELCRFSFFKPNEYALIKPNPYEFSGFENIMDANINVEVVITVSSEDSYFKPQKVDRLITDGKGKTKKQKVTLSTKEQAAELVQKRTASLEAFFADMRKINKRITFESKIVANEAKKAPKKSKKKGASPEIEPQLNNIIITVSRLKSL